VRRKRPAQHPPTLETDIYVTRKSSITALRQRIEQLLFNDPVKQGRRKVRIQDVAMALHHFNPSCCGTLQENRTSCTVHAMGAMVEKAVRLCLDIEQRCFPGLVVIDRVWTDSVTLVDDVINADTVILACICIHDKHYHIYL
jgi:hypothetical protein